MVTIKWQDILVKALPLIPTLIMYLASYKLSVAKNDKEETQDQFVRLNQENERLTKLLEQKDKQLEARQKEIYRLQKAVAMSSTSGNKKEDKNDS
ncbi:hypothetical protein lacNasYZ03_11810 [Lactobacillus nasalidis]|uniref:Holin n=1 Tax=Lactobacillus nasalidis TaxID=2797258 RepID=A0ABQ3W8S2_9LACO|nr:hypothetical protein [Lactobacillus nasalidis]GHV97905.1 hypothetical protein lacNasYZ01_10870 [Lactobacillus nasalidis]GHW00135.1 hypothetical protein lacNasYZ02_15640 [Lactobacillus nasalidis]GHW01494.1 hypothetical protein lacNasYZ03_11810 [Lactobacillus nasalidis]